MCKTKKVETTKCPGHRNGIYLELASAMPAKLGQLKMVWWVKWAEAGALHHNAGALPFGTNLLSNRISDSDCSE